MSGNVEVVRRGLAAMGRWDVGSLLPDCDPEIEFVSLVGQVEGRSYRGHEGIRQFVSDLSEAWDVWKSVPEHFESAGDVVLAIGNTTLRGKGSGVQLEFGWGQIFRFRDGKLWWSKIYSDPAEARRQYEALGANG